MVLLFLSKFKICKLGILKEKTKSLKLFYKSNYDMVCLKIKIVNINDCTQ